MGFSLYFQVQFFVVPFPLGYDVDTCIPYGNVLGPPQVRTGIFISDPVTGSFTHHLTGNAAAITISNNSSKRIPFGFRPDHLR